MAKKSSKAREVFRIQLTPEAKDSLESISDQLGMTQIALTSKLVEWFSLQPKTIQAAILELYPEVIRKEIAELLLTKIKAGAEKN